METNAVNNHCSCKPVYSKWHFYVYKISAAVLDNYWVLHRNDSCSLLVQISVFAIGFDCVTHNFIYLPLI